MKELLILDFDDTLHFINDNIAGTIEKIKSLSNDFDLIIATGRARDNFFDIIPEESIDPYIKYYIFNGGAEVYKGVTLEEHKFKVEELLLFKNDLNFIDSLIFLSSKGKMFDYKFVVANNLLDSIVEVRQLTNSFVLFTNLINYCSIRGLNFLVDDSTSNRFKVSIYPEKVNKVNFVKKNLSKEYNVIYAIGDSYIDYPFIVDTQINGHLIHERYNLKCKDPVTTKILEKLGVQKRRGELV